ncbi:MAG: hypothetical protein ACOC1P_01120 [Minisyncoccales bacterium]
MKKLFFLITLVLLLNTMSAVELDIKKEYDQGETVIGKVSGNFINPPSEENIFLYREHVRVPISPKLIKINDEFYFYFILDKSPGNYSFVIENTKYYIGAETSEKDISEKIKITNNTADFNINKGVFFINNTFELEFQSLSSSRFLLDFQEKNNLSSDNGEIKPYSKDFPFELKSGEKEKVYFILNNFNKPVLKELEFSSENTQYSVPVFVSIDSESTTEENNTSENTTEENNTTKEFSFTPNNINISLRVNSGSKSFFIYLNNTGTEKIENINFTISQDLQSNIDFYEDFISELPAKTAAKLKFRVNASETSENISGYIFAENSENLYTHSKINLNFYSNNTNKTDSGDEFVFNPNESGGDIEIDDPNESGESSLQQIIGWSLLVLVIVFLVWFYFKKYKGTKNTPKLPSSILNKKR